MSFFNTLVSENYKYALSSTHYPALSSKSFISYLQSQYVWIVKSLDVTLVIEVFLGFTSDFRITIVEFYFFLDFGMEFEYSFDHFLAHKNK